MLSVGEAICLHNQISVTKLVEKAKYFIKPRRRKKKATDSKTEYKTNETLPKYIYKIFGRLFEYVMSIKNCTSLETKTLSEWIHLVFYKYKQQQ